MPGATRSTAPHRSARPSAHAVYSNTGIEIAAERRSSIRAGLPTADYLAEAVLEPLGMHHTALAGSPAHGVSGCVADLAAVRRPRCADPPSCRRRPATLAFTSTFPDLSGIVPGVGRFAPCPWGLGFELRGDKSPHWTATGNSSRTVGHFGGAGTMLWFDPVVDVGLVALTDRPFDTWALEAWPVLGDAVLAEFVETPTLSSTGDRG